MGVLGLVLTLVWFRNIHGPLQHPRVSPAEIETIESGGGLVHTDQGGKASPGSNTLTWTTVGLLLSHRMLVGVYIGQYCITTLTWFFLTWFPIYLAQARHMSILKVDSPPRCRDYAEDSARFSAGSFPTDFCTGDTRSAFARKVPIMAGWRCR